MDAYRIQELIANFVCRANREKEPVEAISVLLHNREVASYRWVDDRARDIYSHTKSFVSIAVGIAIEEGLLNLETRLAEIFPEDAAKNSDPRIHRITLRDLLMMASGFGVPLLNNYSSIPENCLDYLMTRPILDTPGTKHVYSNGDTTLIGLMLEKTTGVSLGEYMYEKVLKPMDIPKPEWRKLPSGQEFGAGGMVLRLSDMMKLGQLCLAGGVWQGKRIVSEEWIREATKKQIDTLPSLWNCGYGYQFKRSPYPDSYRAAGLFGQVTTVLPQIDAIVGIQCGENVSGSWEPIRLMLHEEVLSKMTDH